MQGNIAIVIAAFNRPHSLARLLKSIRLALYDKYANVPLIISIDFSGNDGCYQLAEKFEWPFGEKTVIRHPQNLKLKTHMVKCGDLTANYDAIIMLEDDLFVSPLFYDYAQQAYAFYGKDTTIAGIGLYQYRYNELAYCPFEPITDGYDNYFMQVPCSCGQLWTTTQWNFFKDYLINESENEETLPMPQGAKNWPVKTSWKRSFFKYMIEKNKYFVYPRISLTTNFGDIGAHYTESVLIWQSPLLYGNKCFRFSTFDKSRSIYDAFFELHETAFNKLTNQKLSICFDLNGTKELHLINSDMLVSSKFCKKPIKQYNMDFYPYECNIVHSNESASLSNACFSYGYTSSFTERRVFDRLNSDVQRVFFNTGFITQAVKQEMYKTLPYRIGVFFLAPIFFSKRVFRKIISLLQR